MPKCQPNLVLDEATISRLEALAVCTGRSKTFYANEAMATQSDALESYILVKEAIEEFRQGDDAGICHSGVVWDSVVAT